MNAVSTIAALATAPGAGAVAIIRLSGPESLAVLERVFQRPGGASPWPPRRLCRGRLAHPESGRLLDDGLAVWFPGPRSFTGEDSAEIQGHGGPAVSALALEAVLAAGAELAAPGEFTKRAYLNGRLDLAQAEAVADLVAARSAAETTLAARQLAGGLSARVEEIAAAVFSALVDLEAGLDFSEEVAGPELTALADRLGREVQPRLTALREAGRAGRPFRYGLKVALAGAPNVGKSSLFNALAGAERALVSPRAGTTRDYLTAEAIWNELRVELYDTAGLSAAPTDELDELGQARSRERLAEADLVLWVRDCAAGPRATAAEPEPGLDPERTVVVWNKLDLAPPPPAGSLPGAPLELAVSARTGLNLPALKAAVVKLAIGRENPDLPEVVPSLRHQAALARADEYLRATLAAIAEGAPPDICAFELRSVLNALGDIRGLTTADDILNEIFSRFCLGK
ncbi:MAG: tRNA uridine-5-carboxymethylaminomethyl(34) synthesis GTPase MnmE [Candidatus Adiutrix sp.]|jgi:tRNA modification GTPase|nr:tRNA uridine-5-carboxymethylaminomethyl(34) synthesis GTPase MnmE [Candidatus Adiutrix sp.]